jgi:hypothetical protein
MAKAQLARSPHERGRKMPTKVKKCKFPGCNVEFEGIGAAKYCEEHRKPEYRKQINEIIAEKKNKETNNDAPEKSNMIVDHDHKVATVETFTCLCGREYKVKLFPNIDIYPKFCEEHRNPYKRDMLLKDLGHDDQLEHRKVVKNASVTDVFGDDDKDIQIDDNEMNEIMKDLEI